ncbi:GNAT family N-acetyltransferase [Gordonia humi]
MSFGPPPTSTTPEPTTTVEVRTDLHRWTLRAADRSRPAAVVTARPGIGAVVVDIVVAPEYRSTGVATAAVERLLAAPERLVGDAESILACAYGSHPAALRLAARFGSTVVAARHHLVRPDSGPARRPPEPTERAPIRDDRWAVLAETPVDGGPDEIVVDADDDARIELLRSAGLRHDRTDVLIRTATGSTP